MKTRRFVIRKSVQQNSSLTLRYVSKKSSCNLIPHILQEIELFEIN